MEIKHLIFPIIFLLCYYVASIVFYMHVESWNLLDSLYFMSSTLSLIGLGDIYPKTDWGKIYTAIFAVICIGMTLITISIAMWLLSEKTVNILSQININRINEEQLEEELNEKVPSIKKQIFKTFSLLFIMLIILITTFAVCFKYIEDWTFIDSFYFAVCMLTTIGYGDIVPIKDEGKIFFIISSFFGTFCLAKILNLYLNLMSEYRLRKFLKNFKRNNLKMNRIEFLSNILMKVPNSIRRRRLEDIFSEYNDYNDFDNMMLTV